MNPTLFSSESDQDSAMALSSFYRREMRFKQVTVSPGSQQLNQSLSNYMSQASSTKVSLRYKKLKGVQPSEKKLLKDV